MTRAAWWHIYKLASFAGLIAAWRIQVADGWIFHSYLLILFSLLILAHSLSLIVLTFQDHKHTTARCTICRQRAYYVGDAR